MYAQATRLRTYTKKECAPFRRCFLGNRYASGHYLDTTPPEMFVNLREESYKFPQIPGNRYRMADHRPRVEKKLHVTEIVNIAAGGYGQVYICKGTGEKVKDEKDQPLILKAIPCPRMAPVRQQYWKKHARFELYILHKFPHENIVKFYNYMWIYDAEHPQIECAIIHKYEHMECTLADCLKKADRGYLGARLNQAEMHYFARVMGNALEYLHDNKIVHHDFRPQNVMIKQFDFTASQEGVADQLLHCLYKINDLGTARRYKHGDRHTAREDNKHSNGARQYASYEKRRDDTYNPYLADAYAFGATLLALLMGVDLYLARYEIRGCVDFVYDEYFRYDLDPDKNRTREEWKRFNEIHDKYRTAIRRLCPKEGDPVIQLRLALSLYFK